MINPERRPKHKHASTKQHDGGAGAQESTQRQAATGVYTPTITKEKQAARVVTKVSSRVHTPRSRPSALMTWKTLGLISLLSPAAVHGASRAEQWTARLGPGSVPAPHSSVPFSARPAWRSEKRFGLVFFSYWSEISETIASGRLCRSCAPRHSSAVAISC